MASVDYSALDEALEILEPYGPEYRGGLTNHGPMAVEALCALGRADAVIPWVDRYRKGLEPRPFPTGRIAAQAWRDLLGRESSVADWMAFFENEMQDRPWREVLTTWVPRLAGGLIAAATHGPIRVGHAARGLAHTDTAQRRRELAEALGYWAATFHVLPGRAAVQSSRTGGFPSKMISTLQVLPLEQRGNFVLISQALAQLDTFAPFANILDLVDSLGDGSAFLSDLTATFARVYLGNAKSVLSTIVFVHSVTGPSSLRPMLPYLSAPDAAVALRYGWQAAAALFTVYGLTAAPEDSFASPSYDREDLVARAIESGDEHAIKFTEVCLREYELNPQPEYLVAAHHASGMLRH
ncbi:MAG TPA: questin oxidase family protein [Candidatus Binataceae bacterium]|nr:questin oxidase family protein [Candidatus Binataceae bacterium]